MKRGSNRALRQAFFAGSGTFVLAILVSWPAQTIMLEVLSPVAAAILLVIIAIGVLSDTVGVAVTVADDAPFHAMSSRKVSGARYALWLVRNADRVANFCNDIVGDIAGIISGAAGAVLVLRFAAVYPVADTAWAAVVMTSMIAGLTVAGKAIGKIVALNSANAITFKVARLLFVVDIRRRLGNGGRRKMRRGRDR